MLPYDWSAKLTTCMDSPCLVRTCILTIQASFFNTDEYFKANCHPMCLESCVSSCMPGCCREHDKVSVKTGLGKHCHPHCLVDCAPSCGSGCCSAEEERNRGHKFLHYQRMADYQKTKEKALAKQHDEPRLQHDYSKCHPQCKQTCIASCGPGCCTKEGERMRDEQQRKEKDERERERKEKEQTKAAAQAQREKDLKEIYKTQQRFCPAPCPKVRYVTSITSRGNLPVQSTLY